MSKPSSSSAFASSLSGHEIRSRFLRFFEGHGHHILPSGPLRPKDPSLLFTNAGMVPLKGYFLGLETPPHPRLSSSQCCVRAGGKHNDLEEVGYSDRHHTFFEMLGNFSVGDYFKQQAIEMAWAFLTEQLGLPKDKLYITYHHTDEETKALWQKLTGWGADRILPLGDASNFWQMGDTGPCGPCTEIFFDHGEALPGGKPGTPEEDGPRYVEIWNLVFTQFDRQADGTLVPLPHQHVDTGMGLERITSVMQRTHDNYQTDLFEPLFEAIARLMPAPAPELSMVKKEVHARILADHLRTTVFLIAEANAPGREGAGYVLRRLMRRALRHAHELGISNALSALSPVVIQAYQSHYPHLADKAEFIQKTIETEQAQFGATLQTGMQKLRSAMAELVSGGGSVLDGALAFVLYDTYGFPLDMTEDALKEQGMTVDHEGFNQAMAAQKARSRLGASFESVQSNQALQGLPASEFVGYDKLQSASQVVALLAKEDSGELSPVRSLRAGEQGAIVLAQSSFYPESGGQVGDQGLIAFEMGFFEVHDTQRVEQSIVHHGELKRGVLRLGAEVQTHVPGHFRQAVASHHSATHLLHAALKKVLGAHVAQKGSKVAFDELRFDFSHPSPLSAQELKAVQAEVDAQVLLDTPVTCQWMPLEKALQTGAESLFGEKYGSEVRVLSMGQAEDGPYSLELCGGTHVAHTLALLGFKIMGETGVASGIRRITAKSGPSLFEHYRAQSQLLGAVSSALGKGEEALVVDRLEKLQSSKEALSLQLDKLQSLVLQGLLQAPPWLDVSPWQIYQLPAELSFQGLKEQLIQAVPSQGVIWLQVQADRVFYLASSGSALSAKAAVAALNQAWQGKGGGNEKQAQGSASIQLSEQELKQTLKEALS